MGLLLAIDASSRTYAVAAGTGDRPDAVRTARRGDPGFEGVGGLASAAVADLDARFADIEVIAVDTGPGGLSSIRSAVAYANGLAFSLGVRVFPVTSLELMAIAAEGSEMRIVTALAFSAVISPLKTWPLVRVIWSARAGDVVSRATAVARASTFRRARRGMFVSRGQGRVNIAAG